MSTERATRKLVGLRAKALGFTVHAWRPGDGKYRYSLERPGERHMFAFGSRHALDLLYGWERGYEAGQRLFERVQIRLARL